MKNKGIKTFLGFIGASLLAIALFLGVYNLMNGNKGKNEIASLNTAYNNSVKNGFDGSMADWLSSIDEKFSYEVAVENGFHGTKEEWYTDLIEIINNYMKDEPEPLTYGITNVQVVDGNLVFTFSDGSRIDVGAFGKPGESGAAGAPGPAGKDGTSVKDLDGVTIEGPDASSGKYKIKFHWTSSEDGSTYEETTNEFALNVSSIDVVDNLTTDDATKALSAKQGKKLADTLRINDFATNTNTYLKIDASGNLSFTSTAGSSIGVVDNLTSTSTTDALSANQGKFLGDTLNVANYASNKGKYLYIDSSTGKVGFTDATNVTVDSALSDSSTNPVQNKIIKGALDTKFNISGHTAATEKGKYLKIDDSGNVSYVDITGTLPAVSGANKYLRINSANNGVEWNAPVSSFTSITTSDNNLVTAGAVKTELDKKVNVSQGADNKDKILKVNASGNLELADSPAAITVDTALNKTSTNPVQNQVIFTALNDKVDKTGYSDADKGKYLYINDAKEVALGTIPDALPAIGDNAYNYLRVKSDKSGSEWTKAIDDASKIGNAALANDLVTASAINTALSGKVDVYQGEDNKDKILKVNASGRLELADGGASYTGDWDGDPVLATGDPTGTANDFEVASPLIGAINVDDTDITHRPAIYKEMIDKAKADNPAVMTDEVIKQRFGYDTTNHTLASGSKYKGETAMTISGPNKGSSMTTVLTNVVLDDFGHIEWIDKPVNMYPITAQGTFGQYLAFKDDKLYWEDSISLNDPDAFSTENKSRLLKALDADIYIESKLAGLVIPKTAEGIGADSDAIISDYSEEYVKTLTKTDSPAAGSDAEAINKKIELYSKKIFSKTSPITFGGRYYIALDTSDVCNMYISFAPNDSTDTSKPMSMHTLIVERDDAMNTQTLTFTEYNGSTISMDKINNSTDANANRKTLATLAFNHSLQGLLDSIPEETIKSETIKYYDDDFSYGRAGEANIYEGSIIRDNEEKVLMKMPDGTVGWSNNLTIPILDLSTMVEGEVWFEIPGNLHGITDAKPLKANLYTGHGNDPTLKNWYDDLYNPFPGTLNHFATLQFISNFLSSTAKTSSTTTYNVNSRISSKDYNYTFQLDGPNVPYQYVAVLDEDAIGPSFRESLFYGDTSYLDSVDFTYDLGKGDYSTESISFSELEYGAPCPLLVTFTNFFGFSGKTSTNAEYKDMEDYGIYNHYAEGFGGNYLEPLRSYLFQPVEFRIGSYDYVPHTRSDTEPAYTGNYHQNQMKTTRRIYTEITYYCIVFDEGAFSWSYNAQYNDGGKTAGDGKFDILTLKLAFYPEGNYLTSGEVSGVKLHRNPDEGLLEGEDNDEHRYPSISYNFGEKDAPCIKMTLQRGTWSN